MSIINAKNLKHIWPYLFSADQPEATQIEVITEWEDHKNGATFRIDFYDDQERAIGNIRVNCTGQELSGCRLPMVF